MTDDKKALDRKLDSAGSGLVFIWIGIALLTGLGWGWGLLGLAALLLSGAALRRANGLPVQGFWVVVGLVCLAVAIWELFALSWPLIPVLIICFGVLILSGAFRPVHKG